MALSKFALSMISDGGKAEEEEVCEDNTSARRNRYRDRRDALSHMLLDGEKHQVWKPGCAAKRATEWKESPSLRKKTMFRRIDTCRSTARRGAVVGGVGSEKRMEQWKKIQEEMDDQEEVGEQRKGEGQGVGEQRKGLGEGQGEEQEEGKDCPLPQRTPS